MSYFMSIYVVSMSRRGGQAKRLVLEGNWWFLNRDMEDRVICDVMDVLDIPQGSYPESFIALSLFLTEL